MATTTGAALARTVRGGPRPRHAVALLATALVACGAATAVPTARPTPSPPPGTGITVTAEEGPTCPVERVGGPPCVRPVSVGIEVTAAGGGRRVASVTTDGTGHASLALSPGDYIVAGVSGSPFPRAPAPQTVHVTAGAYTAVTLHFDTGIR